MSYNNASKYYWCYAIEYYCYTFNCANGVIHITREQRQQQGGIAFATKAQSCRMLGYVHTPNIKMANTYIVLINNGVYYRHDCYFEHYQDNPSLLQEDLNKRYPENFPEEIPENYDESFRQKVDDFPIKSFTL
jgi:hypothetical protein